MSKAGYRATEQKQPSTGFEEEIANKHSVFVLFYASWCPFCQSFLTDFEEYVRTNPSDYIMINVDDEPELCDKYAIEYYPTVLLFKKGKLHKRLDAKPGFGLTKNQLNEFTKNP